jgi:hypothetical protein
MKAVRTNFDEMWEKYFDSYPGWLYVFDRVCPSLRCQPEEKSVSEEEFLCSFFLSDPEDTSSDKFYPVDKNTGYIINGIQNENLIDFFSNDDSDNSGNAFDMDQEKQSSIDTFTEDRKISNNCTTEDDKKNDVSCACKPLTGLPDNIIFECDTGLGTAFISKKEESLNCTAHKICLPKTLGTISIDAACLKKPKIKTLFSCNIFFKPRSGHGTAQLEFILSRSCNNSAESQIGNWLFNLEDRSEPISQTFRLSCCNNNSYPGFYNYYIRVIPVYIRNCSVMITNCHMDAFAQSKQGVS